MNELTNIPVLPSLTPEQDSTLIELKEEMLKLPQLDLKTEHLIHGGMYFRSLELKQGTVLLGARIIVPTVVTIVGSARLFTPEDSFDITGFAVLPGYQGRRMVMLALSDVKMSMAFKTDAKTVQEAEAEFTDESDELLSRTGENSILITGDQ